MTVHLRFFVPFFASVLKQIKVCDEDVLMRRDFLVNPSFEEKKKQLYLLFSHLGIFLFLARKVKLI